VATRQPSPSVAGIQPADVPAFIRALAAATLGTPDADKRLNEFAWLGRRQPRPGLLADPRARSRGREQRARWSLRCRRRGAATRPRHWRRNWATAGSADGLQASARIAGEILLRAGRPAEAVTEFRKNLAPSSEPGSVPARLCAGRGDNGDRPAALASYGRLLQIWDHADKDLPELREARGYVQASRE
jgi:hypothetical protein